MSANKRFLYRYLICITTILLCLTVFLPHTSKAESDNSISLVCRQESDAVKDMYWKIYKVGERKNGDFVLTGAFTDYPINLRDMTADSVSGAAKAMEGYILKSKVPHLAETHTDSKGTAVFPGLDAGLYFAVAAGKIDGNLLRRADPLFFEVTNTGYESTLFPKVYTLGTLADEITNYTVKKVWEDSDNTYLSRPVNVTVDIFKDGECVETVTLSEENKWTYSWISDEPFAEWRVVERYIPARYEVSVGYNFVQYLIKNTYVPEIITDGSDYVITTAQPPVTTSTTTTSTVTDTTTDVTSTTTKVAGGTDTTDVTTYTTSSTTEVAGGKITSSAVTTANGTSLTNTVTTTIDTSSSDKNKLPQTGQLWWPIPFLFGGGFLMLITAAVINKKSPERG